MSNEPGGDYERFVRVARSLMITLRRPDDRMYCEDILHRCEILHNSGMENITRSNNIFLAYFIRVLYATCEGQPLEVYDQWYKNCNPKLQTAKTTKIWLEEKKKYFAMGKTCDGGVILYSAFADNAAAGWDKGGLAKYVEQNNPAGASIAGVRTTEATMAGAKTAADKLRDENQKLLGASQGGESSILKLNCMYEN